MNSYAAGSLDALSAYALEKEAVDFLGPEMAKYMRRTLLGIPVATFLGARALGYPENFPPPPQPTVLRKAPSSVTAKPAPKTTSKLPIQARR